MEAYKVFDADLKCKGFQYEVGKTYKHAGDIKLCHSGFHACKELVDCLEYYGPADGNRICEVKLGGEILGIDEKKQCVSEITIVRELDFFNLSHLKVGTSQAANCSQATHMSQATNMSEATNHSQATNCSQATHMSEATNGSMFINRCKGVNESLFCSNLDHSYYLFNKQVTEERIKEIKKELNKFDWLPKFLNIDELIEKYGPEIKRIPITRLSEISVKEAYSTIPPKMCEYIQSLPEYDDKIFREIIGRD